MGVFCPALAGGGVCGQNSAAIGGLSRPFGSANAEVFSRRRRSRTTGVLATEAGVLTARQGVLAAPAGVLTARDSVVTAGGTIGRPAARATGGGLSATVEGHGKGAGFGVQEDITRGRRGARSGSAGAKPRVACAGGTAGRWRERNAGSGKHVRRRGRLTVSTRIASSGRSKVGNIRILHRRVARFQEGRWDASRRRPRLASSASRGCRDERPHAGNERSGEPLVAAAPSAVARHHDLPKAWVAPPKALVATTPRGSSRRILAGPRAAPRPGISTSQRIAGIQCGRSPGEGRGPAEPGPQPVR